MFQAGEFRTCWGRSTEMGQDGIGATLTGSLEPGEIVTLDIPLPLAPYPIKVRAIVRYRQGLRYGFEFLTLTMANGTQSSASASFSPAKPKQSYCRLAVLKI